VETQAISESFLKVPHGVNHAVDWTENIVSCRWNSEREFPNSGELGEQAFCVQEPRIGKLVRRESLLARSSRRNMN